MKREITLGNKRIGDEHPVYIIAEIGINHNGDINTAQALVKAASDVGVDAVKFQIITPERCYVKKSESYEIFKKIQLNKIAWKKIMTYAEDLNIDFFATFGSPKDIVAFSDFNIPILKISSTNVTNFHLLDTIAEQRKPVIISTGTCFLSEVKEAVRFLEEKGLKQIAILQCTSLYPTSSEDVNLNVITTLKKVFPHYPVGFSDHTKGIHCAIASVALGAQLIEKHFTLDNKMHGSDHHFSMTPREMKRLVYGVREVESALGTPEKRPVPKEISLRNKLHRSIVALKDIKAGDRFTKDIVGVKRSTVAGLPPKFLKLVFGRIAKKDFAQDDPITFDDIQTINKV